MTFTEAMKAAVAGKRVRCDHWDASVEYVTARPDYGTLEVHRSTPLDPERIEWFTVSKATLYGEWSLVPVDGEPK